MDCPLCNSFKTNDYCADKHRKFLICERCTLVFVSSEYYLSPDEEKQRYDQHENKPEDKGYQQFLNQLADPMIRLIEKKDAGLDFGAGPTPALAKLFEHKGFILERFDPFYANNPSALSKSYNFITATEVIEHLHQPGLVFSQLRKLLTVGGHLGLMTKFYPEARAFKNWWYKNDLTHVCFYHQQTFEWIAKNWNMQVVFQKQDVTIFKVT